MALSPRVGRWLVAARRHLGGAFTERLMYKGAALFMALVLWLVVSADQPAEEIVPVRLQLQMDSTLVLAAPAPVIQARVVGPLREVLKLYATPPMVQRVLPEADIDSIRLQLDPRDVIVPPGVNVRVSSLEPSSVGLTFTTRVTRRVPVQSRLRITVDSSLRALGPPRLVPDSVTVVGSREQVEEVGSVLTVALDVMVGDTNSVLIPLDTSGLGVRTEPSQVYLRVRVIGDTLLPMIPFLLPWNREL